jgi:hypothetical protein
MMSHPREGGIAEAGVEANIGFADGPEGEQQEAVRNPVCFVNSVSVFTGMTRWFGATYFGILT